MENSAVLLLVGILAVGAIVLAVRLQMKHKTETLHDNWQALVSGLEGLVKKLEDGVPAGLVQTMLKKGEVAIDSVPAKLLEYRSGGNSYQGGSQGVSIRIAKGISYRVGANRGQLVRNPEQLQVPSLMSELCLVGNRRPANGHSTSWLTSTPEITEPK
jgi:hypothetical protein